jgi:hypothetical protein
MVCYQMAMNAFTLGGLTFQIMFFNNTFLDDSLSFFLSCFEEGFNGGRFKWVMKKWKWNKEDIEEEESVGGKKMALKVGLLLSGSWNLLKGQYYSHFTQQQQQEEHPPTHPQYTQSHE